MYVNTAPKLQLSYAKEPFNLTKHLKSTTFDDQSKTKNYGRLIIIFSVDKDKEKLFLRFNFTVNRGTWAMKSVDVDYKGTKTVLNIEGGMYNVPSAPIGFSYRCSTRKMIFTNGNDTLELDDYQVYLFKQRL